MIVSPACQLDRDHHLQLGLPHLQPNVTSTRPRGMRLCFAITVGLLHLTTVAPVWAGDEPNSQSSSTAFTLEQLVAEALKTSGQIRISEAQVGQAKALFQFAAAQAYPVGTAQVLFGGPTPEARLTDPDDPLTITPATREGDFNFGQLGISVRANAQAVQPLYTFGKIHYGRRAADYVVRAARHQKQATQASVIVNVTKAFWTVQLTRSFLRSLDEGTDTLAKVLVKIEELLDNDNPQVTENDRLRLKYALAQLKVRRTEASNANQLAERALLLLLGWDQTRPIKVAEADLDDLPQDIPSVPELVRRARLGHPELAALRDIRLAAKNFAEVRRRQLLPDFFLGGFLEYAYTSNATNVQNPFIKDNFNFFNVAVGLGFKVDLDIFHKLAKLEQAEAETRVRAQQAQFAHEAVSFLVYKLHTEIKTNLVKVDQIERANRTARSWLAAASLAYDIGLGAADELIDAFLAFAAAEADLHRTRFETHFKLVEIAQATGRLSGSTPDAVTVSTE